MHRTLRNAFGELPPPFSQHSSGDQQWDLQEHLTTDGEASIDCSCIILFNVH